MNNNKVLKNWEDWNKHCGVNEESIPPIGMSADRPGTSGMRISGTAARFKKWRNLFPVHRSYSQRKRTYSQWGNRLGALGVEAILDLEHLSVQGIVGIDLSGDRMMTIEGSLMVLAAQLPADLSPTAL